MGWLSRNKRPAAAETPVTDPSPQAPVDTPQAPVDTPQAPGGSSSPGAPAGEPGPSGVSAATDPAPAMTADQYAATGGPQAAEHGQGAAPEMGRYGPKVHIARFDVAPPELGWQTPLGGELYRLMPGPDRPDYSLMVLERPLHFYPAEGFDTDRLEADQRTEDRRGRPMVRVHALLLCARFVGEQLHPGMSDLAVNIAYVIDNSLARDERVDFAKIEYAAVGFLSEGLVPRESDPAAASATAESTDRAADTTGSADHATEPEAQPEPAVQTEPAPDAEPIDPGDVASAGPPPMVLVGQVFPEVARTLKAGIEELRGTAVERLTVSLALDEQHRVTGLSGNADGQPPVPTPDTFERLNEVLARLNSLPADHAIKGLTLRVDGNDFSSDVEYRS